MQLTFQKILSVLHFVWFCILVCVGFVKTKCLVSGCLGVTSLSRPQIQEINVRDFVGIGYMVLFSLWSRAESLNSLNLFILPQTIIDTCTET